jgi:hypothetical protein
MAGGVAAIAQLVETFQQIVHCHRLIQDFDLAKRSDVIAFEGATGFRDAVQDFQQISGAACEPV